MREYLEEIARRQAARAAIPDVLKGTFPEQRAFIEDKAKLKALFCTRRSAKSYSLGIAQVKAALDTPNSNHLFTGLTRQSARGIVWKDVLREIDHKFGINASFNETDLVMRLPNRSEIWVTGIDADAKEMRKVLGRKYKTAAIDEASMYSIDLRNFVYGVLQPAMTDPDQYGERGVIMMAGTASDFPQGLFYDITTKKEGGWSFHTWTAYQNPYVARQWTEAIDEIKRNRPLYMDTPQFKQWFLNAWVIDDEKLVYRFNRERNLIKETEFARIAASLNPNEWTYVLGVDTGWEDANAFVLTAYHVNNPHLYVLKVVRQKKLTFDQVAQVIQVFQADKERAPNKIFIDGANKQGVESMRARTSIPFEYAEKQDKATFIELCNADLIQSKIRILDTHENRPLWEEMSSLVWVTDGDKIKIPKKEHPNLPNHAADAFLYAWRCGYHYHWGPVEKKPPTGSKAWYEQQAPDIWEREREALEREQEKPLWPDEPSWPSFG